MNCPARLHPLRQKIADHMTATYGWRSAPWTYTLIEREDGTIRVVQGSGNTTLGVVDASGAFTVTHPKL